jgi:deoxyribodipyrimidine photolyase-like uncharacterized protein
MAKSYRHLVLILGDQLNLDSSALADFDPKQDAIWMAEVLAGVHPCALLQATQHAVS